MTRPTESSIARELRGLLADRLLWWAFRLDPERFIAIDQDGKQVVEVGW